MHHLILLFLSDFPKHCERSHLPNVLLISPWGGAFRCQMLEPVTPAIWIVRSTPCRLPPSPCRRVTSVRRSLFVDVRRRRRHRPDMHGTVKLSAWEEPKDEAVVVVRKNSVGDEVSPQEDRSPADLSRACTHVPSDMGGIHSA